MYEDLPIEQLVQLFLEGDPATGWRGKQAEHPLGANGHSEAVNHAYALRHLCETLVEVSADDARATVRSLFGSYRRVGELTPAQLSPADIRAVQTRMIEMRRSRSYINATVRRFFGSMKKRQGTSFFKWLVEVDALPAGVLEKLRCVPGLRKGLPGVKESPKRASAPWDHVERVIRCGDAQLGWMILVQIMGCGMRPGELLVMRPCDFRLDRESLLWEYEPKQHKNLWRGQTRIIPIGPDAQDLIRRNVTWLWGDGRVPKFGDVGDERFLWAGRDGNGRAADGPRFKRVQYYGKAIARACARAGVPCWTPNQLRKRALTDAARRRGIELAAAVGGHSDSRTTIKHYLDPDDGPVRSYVQDHG